MKCSDVTFLLPTYFSTAKLRNLIDSLNSQTSNSFKIIVQDDSESDVELAALRAMFASSKRLNYQIKSNAKRLGPILNYSSLWKHSFRSDSILMMTDAEDYFTPNFVEQLLEEAKSKSSLDLLLPTHFEVDEHHRIRRYEAFDYCKRNKLQHWLAILSFLPESMGGHMIWHSAFVSSTIKQMVMDFFLWIESCINCFEDQYKFLGADEMLKYYIFGSIDRVKDVIQVEAVNYFHHCRELIDQRRLEERSTLFSSMLFGSAPKDILEFYVSALLSRGLIDNTSANVIRRAQIAKVLLSESLQDQRN